MALPDRNPFFDPRLWALAVCGYLVGVGGMFVFALVRGRGPLTANELAGAGIGVAVAFVLIASMRYVLWRQRRRGDARKGSGSGLGRDGLD
jgi:hypothetical protein